MTTPTFANSGSKQPVQGGEVACCSIAGGPFAAVDAYVSGGGGALLQMRLYATVGALRSLVATATYSGPTTGGGAGSVLEWVVVGQPKATNPVVAGGTQYDLVCFGVDGGGAPVRCTLAGTNAYDAAVSQSGTAALPSNYGSSSIVTNVGCAQLADVGVALAGLPSTVVFDVLVSCGAGSVEAVAGTAPIGGSDGNADPIRQLPLPVGTQYRLAVRDASGGSNQGNVTASLSTYSSIVSTASASIDLAFRDVKSFPGVKGDGVHDDGPGINAALAALAGTGIALWFSGPNALGGGTYKLASTGLSVPSPSILWGSSDATLLAALPNGPLSPTTVAVYAAGTYGADNPLTANTLTGSSQIHVTSPLVAGEIIVLLNADAFHGSRYVVESVSGGGLVANLDRAVSIDYLAGSKCQILTNGPSNILIYGNGMTITGTGARFIELLSCYQCHVFDVNMTDAAGFTSDTQDAASIDTFCVESSFIRCTIRGTTGFALESDERCYIIQCRVEGTAVANQGHLMVDCVACDVIDSSCFGLLSGAVVSEGSANNLGCIGCSIRGGEYVGNTFGIQTSVAFDTVLVGVVARGNTSYGFSLSGTADQLIGCRSNANQNGVLCSNGSAIFDGIDVSQNLVYGIQCQVDTTISGLVSSGGNAGGQVVFVQLGAKVQLTDFRIIVNPAAFAIFVDNGCLLQAKSGHFSLNANGCEGIFLNGGGVAYVDDLVVDGTGVGSFDIEVSTGATLRYFNMRGKYGIRFDAGSFTNRGTVAGSGGGGTAVAWPDLKVEDRVVVTPTATAVPAAVTLTPGTGFSVIDATGSTFDYVVL